MLLNNPEITEEIKEEIKKYLKTNDNENMTTQNLWDAAKAVLRGKLIAIQSYLKKQETSQMNNLTSNLKQLEKEEQINPKVSRRKEIINIRSETNEKEMKGASLVAQWLRIRLPMQRTWVRALVWEDPTCRGATRPVSHKYRVCASGACAPQQERPRQ